ncbi:hypothetical protein OH809_15585 [Streptomyces sp. NBC_00873]|uniref:hypothetical protein n=1 Tax=unclassified Streptomyces TaxID=2593676 RepID=UPI0038675F8E|nr:hypothetical protein OH809_15585 [Streptomyces sp. NBC_00873]WTA46010.1 hypothetical protein OH821_28095 [Streptomyces sp. NBC_00842]
MGIARIAAVAADLVINGRIGPSPRYIEFKRAYLYAARYWGRIRVDAPLRIGRDLYLFV